MNKGYVQSQSNNEWRFFVFSFIGILCFFVPIEIAGTSSIIVDHVHLAIRALFGGLMPYIALIMILAGAILPLIRKSYKNSFADFVIVVFKVLGAIIGVMYVFHFGPVLLFKKDYGPFLFEQLMMPLSVLIPVGAIALSLLVSYGLLEFVGVFMEPVMRPIFKT